MNAESHPQKGKRLIRNSLLFPIPRKEVSVGIYFSEKKYLKRLKKDHFKDYCSELSLIKQIKDFVWLSPESQDAEAVFSFRLDKIPYLARWYFENLGYTLLKKQFRITRRSFTGAFQYWVENSSQKQRDILSFQKFNLYFDLTPCKKSISITLAYEGESKVLRKHTEELVSRHGLDTSLLKSVIFEKTCQPYRYIPEEIRLQPKMVYPLLRRELAERLAIKWECSIDKHKLLNDFKHIQAFYTHYLSSDAFKQLFPFSLRWRTLAPEDIGNIKDKSKKLLFGNHTEAEDIYHAFEKYGPYKLPAKRHFIVFIIYPKAYSQAKNLLENHLNGSVGFKSLQSYSHLPLVYQPALNLELEALHPSEEEIGSYLERFEKKEGIQYFAFYISPYPKYGSSPLKHEQYYKIKELLLKRQIVSQTIVGSGMNQNINFWIPNIALSMVAKMGGIPWKLSRESKKELIVGFGAFRTQEQKHPYIGSSFCFDNEGLFQEFDCWQEIHEWAFVGSLYKAIKAYQAKNKEIKRIIIHYYKELNTKEFRQVEELIDRFDLAIPVIVVRINSTFRPKELVFDPDHIYHLPYNGTYYRLQYTDYLLYINEREEGKRKEVKKASYPLKVSFQSNRVGLFKDPELVQELMQQLYDFSLLHWRSIHQPRLPVTLAYPQYLAQIFPHFKAEILQDIGRTRLWFL